MEKINFIQSDEEFSLVSGYLDQYVEGVGNGAAPKAIPNEIWISPPDMSDNGTFTVFDNTEGQMWVEDFSTLDGAMIWALGIHEIGEKDDFDYPGALKDYGNFA